MESTKLFLRAAGSEQVLLQDGRESPACCLITLITFAFSAASVHNDVFPGCMY